MMHVVDQMPCVFVTGCDVEIDKKWHSNTKDNTYNVEIFIFDLFNATAVVCSASSRTVTNVDAA